MADISKFSFNGTAYNVKDATARTVFTPATSSAAGVKGQVPAPTYTNVTEGAYLKADGSWSVPSGGGGGGGAVNTVYINTTQYPPDSNGKVTLPAYPETLPANGGTADNVSGTVAISHGGTGSKTASGARSNLGLGDAATKYYTTSVSSGSSYLVTSGAVYSELQKRAKIVYSSYRDFAASTSLAYTGVNYTLSANTLYRITASAIDYHDIPLEIAILNYNNTNVCLAYNDTRITGKIMGLLETSCIFETGNSQYTVAVYASFDGSSENRIQFLVEQLS